MRRRAFLAAGVVLLVLVAALAVLGVYRQSRSVVGRFDRIRVGMSEDEVKALLGKPPDYSTRRLAVTHNVTRETDWEEMWFFDNSFIAVEFDPDMHVAAKRSNVTDSPGSRGLWDRLLVWLGR